LFTNRVYDGRGYVSDLERIRDTDALTERDLKRADALYDYLPRSILVKSDDLGLYIRRNRELVGECIMGLADSYPKHLLFTRAGAGGNRNIER
jgi:hypothetical protein